MTTPIDVTTVPLVEIEPQTFVPKIVDAIFTDISGRRGLSQEIDQIDNVHEMKEEWATSIRKIIDEQVTMSASTASAIDSRYSSPYLPNDTLGPVIDISYAEDNLELFLSHVDDVVDDIASKRASNSHEIATSVAEGILEIIDGTGYAEGGYLLIPRNGVLPTPEQIVKQCITDKNSFHEMLSISTGISDDYRSRLEQLRRTIN